ncbi:MAG: hypothetical protein HY846_02530 [Nitrosomonadales bacterium]|nr:hypothetical protein [Nitrosomonadales bacterium]
MRFQAALITGTALILFSRIALAETYDDCVLNGMKGVSSDVAARLVAQSCRNKIAETRKAKVTAFGSTLSEDEFAYVSGKDSVQTHEDSYLSQVLKNKSSFKSITYVALSIKDGDYFDYKEAKWGGVSIDSEGRTKWENERSHTYFYKLSLKPGNEVRLMFRKPRTDSFYAEVTTVLGREAKWSDTISTSAFSSNVKPEPKDPLE